MWRWSTHYTNDINVEMDTDVADVHLCVYISVNEYMVRICTLLIRFSIYGFECAVNVLVDLRVSSE